MDAGTVNERPEGVQIFSRLDVRGSWIVFAAGLPVIVFLTYYNTSGISIWMSGTFSGFRSWDEYLLVNTCFLLFVPCLVTLLVLRLPIEQVGFIWPIRGAARIAGLMFVAMTP